MERLLDNDTRRRLKMIELLYAEPGWQTTKKLTKKLTCSESVLLKDITMYNSLFDSYKQLPDYHLHLNKAPLEIQTSHYGIHFVFPTGLGLDFFYQFVLKNSPAFQLLELIFFDETLTVTQLAEKLFFSVPTVYRLITKINQALTPFLISLKPNPCRMTGEEQQIRYFYSNYFLEAYPLLKWPFQINLTSFDHLLIEMFKDYQDLPDVASFQQLRMITAVQLTRYQQGHLNQLSATLHQQLTANCHSKIGLLVPYEKELQLPANLEAIVDVFGFYLINQRQLDYHQLFPKIEAFILNLANILQLPTPENSEEIATRMLTSIHLTTLFTSGPNFIIYNAKKAFMIAVAENHPCLFTKSHEELIRFLKRTLYNFSPWLINELLYVLFISWSRLLIASNPLVSILIISTKNLGHANLIEEQLIHRYGKRVTTTIYQDNQLDYDILNQLSFNILISDASFFFPPPKTSIWINGYPTNGDWERIELIIQSYETQHPLPHQLIIKASSPE